MGQLNNKIAYIRKTMQIEMQTNMEPEDRHKPSSFGTKEIFTLKSMNFDSFDDWKYFKTNVYEITEDDVFFLLQMF